MRLLPTSKWRALLSLLALALVLSILPFRYWLDEARTLVAVVRHAHIVDEAGVLTFDDRRHFEQFCLQIADESGTDVRFLFVPRLEGETIEAFAVRKARELGLGRSSDRHGLLFVYDVAGRRLRIEVGPKLEGVMTDAFTGYLMRQHVASFFGNGTPALGLRTTLFIVQHRIRQAMLGEEFDPRFLDFIADSRRLAEGAGASAAMGPGVRQAAFLNSNPQRTSPRAVRLYFAPQPTPEAAYQRYLTWLALGGYQTDVPLFTPSSQEYLAGLTMTRGYNDFMLSTEYGRAHRVDENGDLALLYFTDDPLLSPHFFRRTAQGWEMDMVAEVLDTRNYAGWWYTWAMLDTGDDFSRAFADRIENIGEVLRIRGGDNRVLRTRRFPDVKDPSADLDRAARADTAYEALTAEQVAARITAGHAARTLVVLYSLEHRDDRDGFARLRDVARRCRGAGAEILAFDIDADVELFGRLPAVLAAQGAPFPPLRVRPWQPGHLSAAMTPLGINVGRYWAHPVVAVRDGEGTVVRQTQGHDELASGVDALSQACAAGPGTRR